MTEQPGHDPETADMAASLTTLVRQVGALSRTVQDLQDNNALLLAQLQHHPPPYGYPIRSLGTPPPYPVPPLPNNPMFADGTPIPEPPVVLPERFTGDKKKYRAFITSCQLLFSLKPRTYCTEQIKVQTVITLLSGEPQAWAHQLLRINSPILDTWGSFQEALDDLYEDPFQRDSAQREIRSLRQGKRPVEEYIMEFKQHALLTEWNEAALINQFRWGLSDALKDELARVGIPTSLEPLMHFCISVDRRLRDRRQERAAPQMVQPRRPMAPPLPTDPSTTMVPYISPGGNDEPMQIGTAGRRLSPEEITRRREGRLCLYCGRPGHLINSCPVRGQRRGKLNANDTSMNPNNTPPVSPLLTMPVVLQWTNHRIPIKAMIDSGASSCFIDVDFAAKFSIPVQNKRLPINIHLIDGSSLKTGPVFRETIPLQVHIGSKHVESLSFDILPSPMFPLVLGIPWLRLHDPVIHWSSGSIMFPSKHCTTTCLTPKDQTTVPLCSILDIHMKHNKVTIPTIYQEFLDVFDEKGVESLPPHRPYDCPIDLIPGAPIPHGHIYPLSEPELKILKEYLRENTTKGFIRSSTSPAGAGIFFVGKKDGGLRPCVDYRDLNKITIKNRYPLPLIPELMERLRTATIYTKLDLRGAYNLLRIRKGDEWKTAFRTRYGHFEYLVMPYGLCNAPASFQYLVNDIFRDILDQYIIVYLDDILVYSDNLQDHRIHMKEVLSRLRKNHLYAKAEKCLFETSSVSFLGFIISPGNIKMDPEKVKAIESWPTPVTRKETQRFIGFANFYRKFIRSFSRVIRPLTKLTCTTKPFKWTEEATKAFRDLKHRFTTAPILTLPDPIKPYYLEVDASDVATGAILSQRDVNNDHLHPVAFSSKRLSTAESNYDVGDKELLAIKRAFEEWRHLLEGTEHPITVYTDHKNLEYLKTAKRLKPRQARWALFFSRFHFHVTYRPGSKNQKADALSRLFSPESPPDDNPTTILQKGHFLVTQSSLLSRIKELTPSTLPGLSPDGFLRHHNKIFVPQEVRPEVLSICHDSTMAGHGGMKRTTALVSRYFTWPSMGKSINQYVRACPICNISKSLPTRPAGLLQPLPIPSQPWSHLSVDFIVELPPSKNHTVIMVVVDRFTKMAHFLPVCKLPTAKQTADLFYREIFRLHGVPASIVSDRGSQFTSKFWAAFCQVLRIKVKLSTAYHPQTNGQTERVNQTLEQYIRCFTCHLQDDWLSLLPAAEFAYNSSHHSSLRQSPFFSSYGYHPSLLPDLPRTCQVPDVNVHIQNLQRNFRLLRQHLLQAQRNHKRSADANRRPVDGYTIGQKVWLSTKNIRLSCPSKKLGPKFIGPYIVQRILSPVTVRLKLPRTVRLHPVFHVSLLKPWTPPLGPSVTPPPPTLVDGESEYEIESILDSRYRGRRLEYLLHWKGYGPEERSWELASDVHAPRLLRSFHRSHPDKPGPGLPRRSRLGRGVMSCLARPHRRPDRGRVPARLTWWRRAATGRGASAPATAGSRLDPTTLHSPGDGVQASPSPPAGKGSTALGECRTWRPSHGPGVGACPTMLGEGGEPRGVPINLGGVALG
uniref:Gypsy retrotransposon integrase-like protein 1 n=1 Tax=Leptobrachium leishanense TaxID=445787 RepID=A0A8C5MC00_9ANUR